MRYASIEEMVRNIDRQIFLDKQGKVVMVYAKDNVTDAIDYRCLVNPKKTIGGTLDDIRVVCPPLGLFNTKDKDLILLSRSPRRQYQIGMSNNNTSAVSKVNGRRQGSVDIVSSNPVWYERMLVQDDFPTIDKALQLNKNNGYSHVALGRYLYLCRDDEYKRTFINNYEDRVLASLGDGKSSWVSHSDKSLAELGIN